MKNRASGRALTRAVWAVLFPVVILSLICSPERAIAQRGSKPGQTTVPAKGSSPQPATAQQKRSFSATQLNQLQPRIPPKVTQAGLQAAMAAVETSEQNLTAAAAAMSSYFDREAACTAKSWTTEDLDKGCTAQDTVQVCKEKLVAACAAARGPDKKILWSKVQAAASDLGRKAKAVNDLEPSFPIFNIGISY